MFIKYFLEILGSYFLPHTNTVILLERYCGTFTKPGLPVVVLTGEFPSSSSQQFKRDRLTHAGILKKMAGICIQGA